MDSIKARKRKHITGKALHVALPLLVGLLLLTFLMWWTIISAGNALRDQTLSTASLRARQVDDAIAESVSMFFDHADGLLTILSQTYAAANDENFDRVAQNILANFDNESSARIFVISPDGYVRYSSKGDKKITYQEGYKDFDARLNQSANGLLISNPVMNEAMKTWEINFGQRIMQGGKFVGTMFLAISPYYFYNRLLPTPTLDHDSSWIALANGMIVARNPEMEASIGFTPPVHYPYRDSLPGSKGSFNAVSTIDQTDRMYQWHHLSKYPVIVGVGVGKEVLLEPVEKNISNDRFNAFVGTIVLWLGLFGGIYSTQRVQENIRKRLESEYASNHDPLTGLANRKKLSHFISEEIERHKTASFKFALLFIDLDGFKLINDTYGHQVGDEILKATANRISRCARSNDLVARLGGDEFVVAYVGIEHDNDAENLIARIDHSLTASPVAIGDLKLNIRASIGVATYPDHGATIDELLSASDRAMYVVKSEHQRQTQQWQSNDDVTI